MAGVPGSIAQIRAAADVWHAAGGRLTHGSDTVRKSNPESWQGAAATAFEDAERVLEQRLRDQGERLSSASRLLSSYAESLAALDAKAAAKHHSLKEAESRIRRNPLDIPAAFEVISMQLAERSILRQAQSLADETARALYALVDAELGGNQHWWDPLGWWDDESKPDESVSKKTLEDTNWDPAFVSQGHVGDCYALATIMGYMHTRDGRALLKSNIRWDEDKDGYWVTLYSHGNPTEYFVDKVYEQGADQVDGHTLWWTNTSHNVVSLYEAALAQATSYDDINDGGTSTSAIEAISGHSATYRVFSSAGLDSSLDEMSDALRSGSTVVAGSFPGHGTTPLQDVTIERPDGKVVVTDVDIVSSHAYEVERIESDGSVWVRNPWGPDNSADGGGLMHLTQRQFGSVFRESSFEEPS